MDKDHTDIQRGGSGMGPYYPMQELSKLAQAVTLMTYMFEVPVLNLG
jgi:hypothetical protein